MNIHVIIGEDDFLVAETAKKTVGDGIGLEVIDSANTTNEDGRLRDLASVAASVATPPFLDPKKVTWWKNVGFLPGARKDASEEAPQETGARVRTFKDALEDFAKKLAKNPLPENQHFILSGPKLLMTSIFAKTLKPVAEMVTFASGKPWEMQRLAEDRAAAFAEEIGLKFAPGALGPFVARVGSDSRSLMSELAKLKAYVGDGAAATAADVAEIASAGVGVEPALWDVTDAVGARKADAALAAARRFERENGFAVLMTTVLEKFLRQMAELKDAQERGMLEAATEGMPPFVVRKNTGFLRNWTLRELRIARARFLALREKVVSSSGSADVLVLTELLRALRRG